MSEAKWKIQKIREHVAVIDGKEAPTFVLTNATYLHSIFKKWMNGNIWIHGDRIVYVGEQMPKNTTNTEIVDVAGKKIVPGYIEPHVHPFQLYNPHSFADFSAQTGTTTFIADNMTLLLVAEKKKAFTLLDQLSKLPFSFYWWARFDSQTEREDEREIFSNANVMQWLERPDVLLGGELTGWPRVMHGDDQMLSWMQTAYKLGKKVEGHFPGASDKTLAKMKLFGADGDHEAMTIEEVESRILHGYTVTLRHSSIRPDLPLLLKDIVARGHDIFDHLMMTTDGATPAFYKDGVVDMMIRHALEAGVKPIDAYNMASYNVARYYNMANRHGLIATGRIANLNILEDEMNPTPEAVISHGVWLRRDGEKVLSLPPVDWSLLQPFKLDFHLTDEDFQFSSVMGIEMVNDVITKPYSISRHLHEVVTGDSDECYLMLIDRHGKWRVNTMLKGFATHVKGFASSYSNTGDIILIGKSFVDMERAFEELKTMGGGIAIVEDGEVVTTLPLTIAGALYEGPVEQLMERELALKKVLAERGYRHADAIYTLLFLLSTHLPYIRITPRGLFDVMKNTVLLRSVMR